MFCIYSDWHQSHSIDLSLQYSHDLEALDCSKVRVQEELWIQLVESRSSLFYASSMKKDHDHRCWFCSHRYCRLRSSLLELSGVPTTIETFALTWTLSLCLTLEIVLTQSRKSQYLLAQWLEERSARHDVQVLVSLIARFHDWFDDRLIESVIDFDVIEKFKWTFCKIIRHVEAEVNTVLPWILTLLSSFKSIVSVLRLRKSQLFSVIVAVIDSSSVESVRFDILHEELCFIDDCAMPSWSWEWSEANEVVQSSAKRRNSSTLRNSSWDKAWSIFCSEIDVLFSISDERLWELSIDSMNEKQKFSSILMSLSSPPRLFPVLLKFSAVIRWISHDAEFQQYLHSRLWYLQPSEFETKVRFSNLSWMTCLTSRALRSPCVFRQYYSKLVALGWRMSCLLMVIDKSWCETCQRQPLQKIVARESYKQEDSGNGCLSYRRAQDELYVMVHQPLSAQRYTQSHCEPHHLCAVSLKLRKPPLGYTQPSRVAQPPLIPFSPSLFSCRPIHALYSSERRASEGFHCSSQLNRRRPPWIKPHRTPRRTPRKTLGRAQAARTLFSKANRRWFINGSWLSIGTTETISSWAEGVSMQMAWMKGVRQNGTGRHKKMSSLQQLKSRFRQCWAVHMNILSIKPLPRQHQLVPETQPSWTRRGCSIAASQASAGDVIRSLATASRHSFAGGTVENTLRMVWGICSIDLDAQAIALGRLHLARALVVAMTIAQHPVNNSCHANEARNRRPAMGRKQKNAERERQKGRGSL